MCGRYTLYDISKSKLNIDIELMPNYNVCPSSRILLINNKMEIKFAYWALKSLWSDKVQVINARSETLDIKNMFKNTQRCIFIANGYFEWKKESSKKVPYYHYFSEKMMYFGGIMRDSRACIVTRSSYSKISKVHHRQPVFLEYNNFNKWLDGSHNYKCDISNKIDMHKVSTNVNNPANNFYENIKKID